MRSVIVMFLIGLAFGYLVAGIEASKTTSATNSAPSVHEANLAEPQAVADTPKTNVPEPTYKTITLEHDGMRFAYRTAPDSYDIVRVSAASATDTLFEDGYELARISDTAAHNGAVSEGPQSIQVLVLKNPDKLSPRVWALQNLQYSNAHIIRDDIQDETFGTQSAVTYRADGLYTMEYHIVTAGKYVYVLSGSFDGDASPALADYHQFLKTFELIPPR